MSARLIHDPVYARLIAATRVRAALAILTLACVLPVGSAFADGSSARISASFHPDKLGGMGTLAITIHSTGGAEPLRRTTVRLPAGLGIEIPHIRSCDPARLRLLGPRGCPPQSRLGVGRALAQAQVGSQLLGESVSLWVFLGPFHNLQPTFEILAQGYTPFDERFVLSGTVLPDKSPYGEDLVLSVPAIPTLPLEPDASIVSLSLTIGTTKRSAREPNTAVEPSRCPPGGFPFGIELSYVDGSEQNAATTAPCPR